MCWIEIANTEISEPRSSAVRERCSRGAVADASRGDRIADGFCARPEDVRDRRSNGHALLERLRLARNGCPRPPRRRRDLRRRHAPCQRASTDSLTGRQHRAGRRVRPGAGPSPNTGAILNLDRDRDPKYNTTDVPRIGPRDSPPPHEPAPRRTRHLDDHARVWPKGWRFAPRKPVVRRSVCRHGRGHG